MKADVGAGTVEDEEGVKCWPKHAPPPALLHLECGISPSPFNPEGALDDPTWNQLLRGIKHVTLQVSQPVQCFCSKAYYGTGPDSECKHVPSDEKSPQTKILRNIAWWNE